MVQRGDCVRLVSVEAWELLDLLGQAAYEAHHRAVYGNVRPVPDWGKISPDDREVWRMVADGVRMTAEMRQS